MLKEVERQKQCLASTSAKSVSNPAGEKRVALHVLDSSAYQPACQQDKVTAEVNFRAWVRQQSDRA